MIRMTYAAPAAAMLVALLSVSCNKSKTSVVQKNDSRPLVVTPGRPLTDTPQALQPTNPPAANPPVSPLSGTVGDFSGEVSRGQRFEQAVAPGMVFRLEPYAGNDSGWDIRLAPDTEPSPASIDCIGAISVPRHRSNELSIELSEGKTDQAAALRSPHEFDFVSNPSDCKRAWNLSNSIAYEYSLPDQERDQLDRRLSEIPTGHGQLKVLDFQLSPRPEGNKPVTIEWIKFEVHMQFPQPANPGLAKATANSGSGENFSGSTERAIPYSLPTAFAQLPPKIQSELQTRGCRIPQPYTGSALQNVIQGQFARQGQTDWAVLCSRGDISSILIFWNGSTAAPAEIGSAPDTNFLTPLENGKTGFARAISTVRKDFILKHFKAYGGPTPPLLDHEGINDEFLEKGSTVHYFYRGRWLDLTGSD